MKEKTNKMNAETNNAHYKNHNGITLIALVITIIVMLILVAVTISMAINGGLFGYAGNAARETELAKQEEQNLANIESGLSTDDLIAKFTGDGGGTPAYSASLLDSTTKVLTKTAIYTDTNNDTATIPKGYAIVEDCETINQGLVISDEFDSNGNSIGNEFVWIPVPEKNMTVATLSSPYVGATNCSEPKEFTSTDSNTSSATGGPYAYDSQEELNWYYGTKEDGTTPYFTYSTDFQYEAHYREMAESVNKYGGFYIGRYETTIDSNNNIGSKYNKTVLTSDKTIKTGTNPNNSQKYYYRWWGLYYASRHSNVAENGNIVQTNMIWGQEWDKMISYFDKPENNINYAAIDITNTYDKQQNTVVPSGTARYTPKEGVTNVEEMNDKIFNIYDLRMNAYDWTAEANYTSIRVRRGGLHSSSTSASYRSDNSPGVSSSGRCTRLTLYIR